MEWLLSAGRGLNPGLINTHLRAMVDNVKSADVSTCKIVKYGAGAVATVAALSFVYGRVVPQGRKAPLSTSEARSTFIATVGHSIVTGCGLAAFGILSPVLSPALIIAAKFKSSKGKAPPPTAAKSVLITGGASGMGRCLAEDYAEPGVTLFLADLSWDRLNDVAASCRSKGAAVHIATVDVTDADAVTTWISRSNDIAALDLVITMAGVSDQVLPGKDWALRQRIIFNVNLNGTMNCVYAALPLMEKRGSGQLCLVGSLAGFCPTDRAAYSGSKAAVRYFAESIAPAAARAGVGITVVCPGFVRTPLTSHNKFELPFGMDPEDVVAEVRKALASSSLYVVCPTPMFLVTWFVSSLHPFARAALFALTRKDIEEDGMKGFGGRP